MGAEDLRVEDRILLHLQNFIRYADDYEVPKAMSQKGIGESVWIAWSNVPRAMKKLHEQDLVDERTTRVKGEFRKKKVYFLTPQGFAKSQELQEELGLRRVTVRRGDQDVEMAFADVPEHIGFKVPYLELLRGIDDDGLLDIERAQTRWEEQIEMVDSTARAPKLRAFYGREEELEALNGMVDVSRFIVVHGIAGIGKTSLTVRLLDDVRKETNVLWITLHHWDTLPGILGQLADFLAEAGRRQLRTLLDDRPAPDLGDVYYPLEEALKDLKGVIFIDDFHKASDPVVDLFSMLLEILQDRPSPTFILASRYLPTFYDRRYVVIQKVVSEQPLEGLDRASARAMLEGRALSDADFDHIYSTTKGHPLALELVMQREDLAAGPFKDVMAFVREEVFEGLSEEERRTLSALSVYRANVPREAAMSAASSSSGGPVVLDSLVDRGLVADVGDDEVRLHDLVREFFHSRLTAEERETRHREAAEAWGRLGTPMATVERAYHLERAGEAEAAVATLASESGLILAESGLLRDVMGILEAATASDAISPTATDEADLLRADALAQLDQVDAAYAMYTRVLDRAVAEGERGDEGRILHRIGLLHRRRGQDTEAIEIQQRAIAAFEEVDDESGSAHCHLSIAEVLADLERTEEAIEELGRAHESFTLVEDGKGVATTCVRQASIMLDKEDPAVAGNYLEEALDNLAPGEDQGLLSHTYYMLGEVDRLEEDWDRALEHYQRALDLFMETGNDQMVANACTTLGDAYLAIGDEEKANMYYQRGMDVMVAQ
ncbi:MAG: tetratricopeptide repeat protein [Thermoplasmata archaeon]|nr:tetratricopeptide repeat protein [Thermoplasmata archaeon]